VDFNHPRSQRAAIKPQAADHSGSLPMSGRNWGDGPRDWGDGPHVIFKDEAHPRPWERPVEDYDDDPLRAAKGIFGMALVGVVAWVMVIAGLWWWL
jgi:hypothetical protein